MTHFTIHVLGNVGVDLSMGPVGRLPTWGTEILAGESVYRPGGAAVNVALALAGLSRARRGLSLAELERSAGPAATSDGSTPPEAPVRVYCTLGDDRDGKALRDQLLRAGIPATGLELVAGERTSLGLALVRADGERAFVTDLGALRRVDKAWALSRLGDASGPGWLLATGMTLFPGLPPDALAEVFRTARARGLMTALDTGWDVDDWPPARVEAWREVLPAVDLFLPNESEAARLSGQDNPALAARALQKRSGGTVIVKTGTAGAWVATPHGAWMAPTEPLAVPDTTGAGDVFDAGVLYGLSLGWPVDRAVRLGHRLAGTVLQNRRSYFPSLAEVLA
ncbi:carbohydrate kinase family protein [Caldinitratiruptor microaerophilus]|uniref:Carbohydrate kinase PfkB domain-containing protein n=1 Tax=Caldinitratiruptor microaerophilus TaxID=671077 RepID=A0AA35G9L3_9FIRM|nr:carbohydrate kinase family protein [Caldinitratiruptor microaerophilus]BDG60409.1 hypothetical protein caldi_14990 [Caldinitratiruptor microaerophilus]